MPKRPAKDRGPRIPCDDPERYVGELGVFQWMFEAAAWLITNAVVLTFETAVLVLSPIVEYIRRPREPRC